MEKEELKEYLRNNLKVVLTTHKWTSPKGNIYDDGVEIQLVLENEIISSDFILYHR